MTNESLLQELYFSNNDLIPLESYFESEYFDDVNQRLTNKLSTNLLNLDGALDGGISSELYVLAGAEYSPRHAMLIHLAERFAKTGYIVLYFSMFSSLESIMQKFIMRCDFKLHRDPSTKFSSIIETLQNSNKLKSMFNQKLNEILPQIFVSNFKNSRENVEQMIYDSRKLGKVAVLIDEYQTVPINELDYKYYRSKFMMFKLYSQIYEVPIIMMENLPRDTYSNLWDGYPTLGAFENFGDNILLFGEEKKTLSINAPNIVEIKHINKTSFIDARSTSLIYYPNHYYFQDA